jgi:hypothetical protein
VRIYRVPLVLTSVSVAIDLAELNAATSQMVRLIEIRFSQTSDAGDAQEEQLPVSLVTGHTTSGSGGNASVTPEPELGDSAWGGTCETFNTTQATAGTTATKVLGIWNVRTEFIWNPTPRGEVPGGIWLPYNGRSVIRVPAPADALSIIGEVQFGVVGNA